MRDITLKITGKQFINSQEEDQLEFVTDGKLFVRNGNVYVVYDETEVSGMEGCKTTLRMNGTSVRLKRIGDVGFATELYFEKGRRFSSVYETPFGAMGVEVVTSSLVNNLDMEALKGQVDIEYNVSLDGLAEGKNRLTIDVM